MPEVPPPSRFGFRSALVCLSLVTIFTILGAFWVQQSSLVTGTSQIAESAPPIPAVAALVFLVVVGGILEKVGPSLRLSRAEILVTYGALTFSISFSGLGGAEYFFSYITPLFYFQSPENGFVHLRQYLPDWFVPKDETVIRWMYEGLPKGEALPWKAWALPLSVWAVFWLVLFASLLCLAVLFRKQWSENERLTFPLARFAEELTEHHQPRYGPKTFFRDPVMWIGFGIAFGFNLYNILMALDPSGGRPLYGFNIGHIFTERPWRAIGFLRIRYDLALFALGWLMTTEMLFSVWVSYLVLKAEAVCCSYFGYEPRGLPFDQQQGTGAYVVLALFFFWQGRRHFAKVLRSVLGNSSGEDASEALPYRWAALGCLAGFAALVFFATRVGMQLWVAVLFFGLVFAFALVYSKIRAATGAPMIWLFPFHQQYRSILSVFGAEPLMAGGSLRNLTALTSFGFLARGYAPAFMAYGVDNMHLADEAKVKRRTMLLITLFAIAIAIPIAFCTHLTAYYRYGDLNLATVKQGRTFEQDVVNFGGRNAPPRSSHRTFMAIGAVTAAGLAVGRQAFAAFPVHPLGYAMACAYGHPLWGPFFLLWILKVGVLKYFGPRAYRRMVPGFLGLGLGHFFTAGVIWGGLGMTGHQIFHRYTVFFG